MQKKNCKRNRIRYISSNWVRIYCFAIFTLLITNMSCVRQYKVKSILLHLRRSFWDENKFVVRRQVALHCLQRGSSSFTVCLVFIHTTSTDKQIRKNQIFAVCNGASICENASVDRIIAIIISFRIITFTGNEKIKVQTHTDVIACTEEIN